MTVGDVSTPAGLKSLNEALREKSYLEGYQPSQADTGAFNALKSPPSSDLPHALRWYNHIKSFGDLRNQFPGSAPAAAPKAAAPADDDDDVDLFGSDDENDEEAEKLKQQRLAEYAAKKEKKPGPIAKSSIVLDVKPWDDETDMKEMEKLVRSIQKDGLVWGASKLVPVGYGINKLQIMLVCEDEKVSIEELTEQIQDFEDFVQSVDVAAFNKI